MMLTWMWMGMTLWNMGSHSILGALRDKAGLVGQAKGNKESHKHLQSLIHTKTPRVSVSAWARGSPPGDSTLTAHHKLGSIVLDHLARYTEADVIPCTGEEPGEANVCGTRGSLRTVHGGGSAPSCCAFTHRVAFDHQFTQTHVHRVSDAIQPSHPLSSPSPPAPNPSQHQSLFQ